MPDIFDQIAEMAKEPESKKEIKALKLQVSELKEELTAAKELIGKLTLNKIPEDPPPVVCPYCPGTNGLHDPQCLEGDDG